MPGYSFEENLKLFVMIPSIAIYIIPLLVSLLLVEMIYSYKEDRHLYNGQDTLNNILVGLGYFASNILSRGIMFFVFEWAYNHRLFDISNNWLFWILGFIAADFSFYCYHRVSHEVSWFWAAHVVHHSSEEYNISVAFRLPWITNLTGHFVFWLWMPFLGFSSYMVIILMQVVFIYQFFLHTRLINKLHPVIEFIFNTPSHHRVHHSSNVEYLDKNHGGVLIIWDRLFGTYAAEKTIAYFGLTKKLQSNDPMVIVFHEWKDMISKAINAGSLKNAINYFIKPPGWSPDGSSKTVREMRKSVNY